jgi:putative zinc finger protein
MDTQDLIDQLRQSGLGDHPADGTCADENEIAGYIEGSLDSAGRARLECHLADCPRCVRLVGVVSSLRSVEFESVPEILVARAKRAPTSWKQYWPPLAAAAAIVLAVAVLMQIGVERPIRDEQATRTTRGSPTQSDLHITAPASGAILRTGDLTFRWSEVPGARYYIVRVVTASGELVTEQRVTTNEWLPGDSLALRPGHDYFVRVDAYPAVGPSSSSVHVPFSIRGPP